MVELLKLVNLRFTSSTVQSVRAPQESCVNLYDRYKAFKALIAKADDIGIDVSVQTSDATWIMTVQTICTNSVTQAASLQLACAWIMHRDASCIWLHRAAGTLQEDQGQ